MTDSPANHMQLTILVVESLSEYALDYELMLNGLGYWARAELRE
ncbi:hypothetical protein FBZ98_11265 [Rhizobium sp. ERR 922]|nr:hypothetical protein FBZ98_11265 [Rhizobium sp. ERR 922]TWB88784.1 hypothetical protein FBZ97_11265 [Rhizobium sp. ERR 942]